MPKIHIECFSCDEKFDAYSELAKHIILFHIQDAIDIVTYVIMKQDFNGA